MKGYLAEEWGLIRPHIVHPKEDAAKSNDMELAYYAGARAVLFFLTEILPERVAEGRSLEGEFRELVEESREKSREEWGDAARRREARQIRDRARHMREARREKAKAKALAKAEAMANSGTPAKATCWARTPKPKAKAG